MFNGTKNLVGTPRTGVAQHYGSGLPHSRFLLCTATDHVPRTPELTIVGTAKIANRSTHEPHVWPSTQGCRVLSPSNRRWHLDVRPERNFTTVGRVTSRIDAS